MGQIPLMPPGNTPVKNDQFKLFYAALWQLLQNWTNHQFIIHILFIFPSSIVSYGFLLKWRTQNFELRGQYHNLWGVLILANHSWVPVSQWSGWSADFSWIHLEYSIFNHGIDIFSVGKFGWWFSRRYFARKSWESKDCCCSLLWNAVTQFTRWAWTWLLDSNFNCSRSWGRRCSFRKSRDSRRGLNCFKSKGSTIFPH